MFAEAIPYHAPNPVSQSFWLLCSHCIRPFPNNYKYRLRIGFHLRVKAKSTAPGASIHFPELGEVPFSCIRDSG